MTEKDSRSPAPLDRRSFAGRVSSLEYTMRTNLPTINNDIIQDLLTCIREQQAALKVAQETLCRYWTSDCDGESYNNEDAIEASGIVSAALGKWSLP